MNAIEEKLLHKLEKGFPHHTNSIYFACKLSIKKQIKVLIGFVSICFRVYSTFSHCFSAVFYFLCLSTEGNHVDNGRKRRERNKRLEKRQISERQIMLHRVGG